MKIRPTPLERLHGRLMRAQDHGEADPAPVVADPAAPPAADPPADPAPTDEGSLMGNAGVVSAPPADPADPPADPADPKPPEAVIPETYELAMPEGFEVDPELMGEATPVFKDLKLDNEGANKLVPLVTKLTETIAKRQNDSFQAMASDWARAAQSASDIGGTKWAETENNVARAMDVAAAALPPAPKIDDSGKIALGADGKPIMASGKEQVEDFRKLLNASKLGNHPTAIRMFNFYGRSVGEDSDFVRPDAGAHIKPSREDILYGASETK